MDNILNLKEDKFLFDGNYFTINDLFTKEFYDYINEMVQYCETDSIYDNILYLSFLQYIYAIEYFVKQNHVKRIHIEDGDGLLSSYLIDVANVVGIDFDIKGTKINKFIILKSKTILFLVAIYMSVKQIFVKRKVRKVDLDKNLCVIRTNAARNKILPLDNSEIFFEDKIATGSMYNFFSVLTRLKFVCKSYKESVKLLYSLCENMSKRGLKRCKGYVLDYFTVRFIPVCFYGYILNEIMSMDWKGKFISGNNLDMYAVTEEKVAIHNNVDTICIPHGLEYGFKLPHCFTGNTFYTTSKKAEKHLNELYNTRKFVFSDQIAKKMFTISDTRGKKQKVIFFTEPRDSKVNIDIISGLLHNLRESNVELYIKHHPKDNLEEYKMFANKVKVISKLDDAIVGNICIARKSTILLEGLYNSSICLAILVNEKDRTIFENFPSLSDDRIVVFDSIKQISNYIIKLQCK